MRTLATCDKLMALVRNEKHMQCDPIWLLIGINSFAGVLFLNTASGLNYSNEKQSNFVAHK
jgi:hypothetical protein